MNRQVSKGKVEWGELSPLEDLRCASAYGDEFMHTREEEEEEGMHGQIAQHKKKWNRT